jgi:tetratricopeptide (TPR) repeat protein
LLSGCATFRGEPRAPQGDPAELDRVQVLPLAQTNLAAALASFSAGLLAESELSGEEALRLFLDAIQKEPAQAAPYQKAVRRLVILNRPDEAAELLDHARKAMPGNPDPLRWKAAMLHETSRHDQAVAAWNELLAGFPDREVFPLEAARALYQAGREPEGIAILEPRLERFKHPLEYYRYLIDLYPRAALKALDRAAFEAAALAHVEEAARRYPTEDPFAAQAARLRIRTGDLPGALRHLESIENRRPDDPGVKARLAAVILQAYGDPAMALRALRPVAEDPASSSRVSMYQGILLEAQGNPVEAGLCYERATLRKPAESSPWWKLAQLAFARDPAEARRILEQTRERFPNQVAVLELLANARLQTGDVRGAVELFRLLAPQLMEQPDSEALLRFFLQYAVAALRDGDPLEAADAMARAMKSDRGLLGVFTVEALRTREPEVVSNACVTVESLRADFPDESAVHINLGLLQFSSKQYPAALASFREAEEIHEAGSENPQPLSAGFYYRYGAAAEQVKDFALAEAKLRRSAQLDPASPEPLNHLAYMWAEQGVRLDEALPLSEKTLRLEPLNPAYLDTRGWIHFRAGRFDAAVTDLLMAATVMPDDPTILEHLGDALRAAGRLVDAEDAYRMAAEFEDENIDSVRKKLDEVRAELAKPVEPPPAAPPTN